MGPSTDLYPLDSYVIHGGSAQEVDGALIVETPPEQWAYAVEVPLSRNTGSANEMARVVFEASVEAGRLGIGILSSDRRSFRQEVQISPADGQPCEFEFVLGPVSAIGPLIIRNAFARGASRGKCRILTTAGE
jgi:hypothetical protein